MSCCKNIKFMALLFIAVVLSGSVFAGDWWETVKIKGDLRYRHEMKKKNDDDARHRQRIRARLGISGEVNSEIKATVQIATGSADPVSTNQTLDDGFSSKAVRLDMAYFKYAPTKAPGLTITGGKFKNPFYKPGKSELIWDGDWNPEGGAVKFAHDFDNVTLTLIGAGLWIDERAKDDDSYLAAGQGVLKFNFNENKSAITVGGGFFGYQNTKDFPVFFDPEEPMGNSATEVTEDDETYYTYNEDYELFEAFAAVDHKFDNVPVTVMGDYVKNTAVDSLDTGWLIGVRVGKAKKPGSWAFRYNYREVKSDAVLGAYTDSDFRDGGTNAKGHEFGITYMLAANTAFGFSYFVNEIGLNEDDPTDFDRMQIDLQLKF